MRLRERKTSHEELHRSKNLELRLKDATDETSPIRFRAERRFPATWCGHCRQCRRGHAGNVRSMDRRSSTLTVNQGGSMRARKRPAQIKAVVFGAANHA